jgi:drug/metabolite transporter (DMT)-like permease
MPPVVASVWAIVIAALGVFWMIALNDVSQRPEREFPSLRPDFNDRMFWMFVVFFMNVIGALFYYFMVMKPYPRRRR